MLKLYSCNILTFSLKYYNFLALILHLSFVKSSGVKVYKLFHIHGEVRLIICKKYKYPTKLQILPTHIDYTDKYFMPNKVKEMNFKAALCNRFDL